MNITSILSILKTIVILLAVLALANAILKYINRYMKNQNKIIKVIERVNVNNNSALGVVEICGKYYLMSFTNGDNKILKELEIDDIYLKDLDLSQLKFQTSHSEKGIFSILSSLFEMRK